MRRWTWLWLTCGLIAACHGSHSPTPVATAVRARPALEITDLRVGAGPGIRAGQTALVDYTGWLYDPSAPGHKGREFDSSLSRAPLRFVVGAGHVIKGWDEGIVGMRVGGRRRLVIPPDLAYGDRGAGGVIPPGATLIFDVELVAVR